MKENRKELVQILAEKMGGVMKAMHARNEFPFGEFKLSRPQVMLLFYIAKKKKGTSAKDLAIFLRVTPGAITQFIDSLVRKKLVVREDDSTDRRTQKIKLTKFAQSKIKSFKKNYYKSVTPIFDNLSEKEINQVIDSLNKIPVV